MVTDSQKHKVIKEFLIPDTVKDDIAYCQRSLRDCVKVHQYFVERCNSLSVKQQEQVKKYLLELEDEMRAIGQEQSGLVMDLANRLKHFQRKTANEKHIVLGDDLANGYVAWVLSNHSDVHCNAAYMPHAVSERLNESQLYQKYRLEPVQSCDVGTALPDGTKLQDKRLRKRPVLQTSLLKPKEERDHPSTALKQEPSLTPPSTPKTPPTPPPPQPAQGTVTRTTASRRKTPPEQQPLILKKMLRSRSTTPVVTVKQEHDIKQEPSDQENSIDTEDQLATITLQESAAVKRGRSNLLQALNKAKTTQKTALKQPQTSPPASAIKGGRNNRAGSLNAGEQRSSSVSSDSSNSRASTPGTSCNGGGSGVGNTRKSNVENGTSDESSLERLLPPEEPPCTLPTNIDEWEQYSFLKLFGLYTIEDSNLLKGRKNERKRRSCCSTERKDFHYGRFDYYEQQFYIVQKRRYNVNKRLLFTATSAEKSINKRKPWSSLVMPAPVSLPVQDLSTDGKASFQADSLEREEDESCVLEAQNKLCFVCKKDGNTANTLNTCMDCSNFYHLSCHVDEDASQAEQKIDCKADTNDCDGGDENGNRSTAAQLLTTPRNELCPVCLALAKSSIK